MSTNDLPSTAQAVPHMPERMMCVTDDRDFHEDDLRSLVIFPGGNGDWYVQVAGVNGRESRGVRICTSGGAASRCPGLGVAIADAYRAMKAAAAGEKPPESRVLMAEELAAWRSRFPGMSFDGLRILDNQE